MGKLINRIPGSPILISSLPGSALRMHASSLVMSTNVLKALTGKLDVKRHSSGILYNMDFFFLKKKFIVKKRPPTYITYQIAMDYCLEFVEVKNKR